MKLEVVQLVCDFKGGSGVMNWCDGRVTMMMRRMMWFFFVVFDSRLGVVEFFHSVCRALFYMPFLCT